MKWTVGASRTLYDCPWFRVELTDVTLPAGRTFPLTAATLQHGLDLLGIAAPDRL